MGARPRWQWVAAGLLLVPAALLLTFAFYMPVGAVILGGLRAPGEGGGGAGHVLELLTDPYIRRLIRFTVGQATLSGLLSVAIGVPIAYVLSQRAFPGKSLISSLTMIPFVMPSVAVALGFLLMFGINGWFNDLIDAVFGRRVQVLHSLWAILLAHAFYNAPLVGRLTQAAWERLDPALAESAQMLGASRFAVWKDVTLPAILPGVISGGLLAFIYSLMSFPIILTLGGARFSTLEVEIFTQIRILLDYETGAALATVQAAISLILAYVFLKAEAWKPPVTSAVGGRRTIPLLRRTWSDLWLWLFLVGCAILFVGPVAGVVLDGMREPGGGFSLAVFRRIFSGEYSNHLGGPMFQSIGNSIRFALAAATISLFAGATLVYGTVRVAKRRIAILESATLAPIVVSSVVLAYGMLISVRRPPLSLLSPDWRIPVVHAVLALPFVVRAFRPVLQSVDVRLIEGARTLGASRWRAFIDIELPMAATGLLVAFALAFGLSVSEMTTTLILARPEQVTMPVSVYRLLAARDFHAASGMAVVLMTVTAGLFLLSESIAAKLRRQLEA